MIHGLIAFLLSRAAKVSKFLHMVYYPKPGGDILKPENLSVSCFCAAEGSNLIEIIQSSFQSFLKKELQDIAKWGSETV